MLRFAVSLNSDRPATTDLPPFFDHQLSMPWCLHVLALIKKTCKSSIGGHSSRPRFIRFILQQS